MADGITVNATDCYTMTGMSMDRSQASGGVDISVTHPSDGTVQTRKILGQ